MATERLDYASAAASAVLTKLARKGKAREGAKDADLSPNELAARQKRRTRTLVLLGAVGIAVAAFIRARRW